MVIYYIEHVYLRPYVYSFCQIFQALRLFPTLRLLGTLEYQSIFMDIFIFKYRKVASSRPVYYSIFDHFWGATNQDVLLTEACYCSRLYGMLNSKWLKSLLRNLQFHNRFCINFHKSDAIEHVYYSNSMEFFFVHTKNSRNFLVKFKFFLQIKVVPIIYEWGKVEKVLGNKTGITIYSWTVWVTCLLKSIRTRKVQKTWFRTGTLA